MPITTTGAQLTTEEKSPNSSGGWWSKFIQGLQNSNFSFTSGANGWSFGGTGGGSSALPTPPSTQDLSNWLPYLVGGAVLFKLLK